MRTVLVLATILAAVPMGDAVAATSSFDCGTAANRVEKLVCGDAPLAALDGELARLYRLASTGKRAAALRSSQAKWREERNGCATAADVAGQINKRAGKNIISATYVWQLRVGRADNPTVNRLKALAEFFHVPASYLLGGDDELDRRTEAELDDLELMQRHRVRQVAYQMASLADDGQAAVQDLALRIAELPQEGREVMLKVLAGLEDAAKLTARLSTKDQQHV